MKVSLIFAADENNGIGYQNRLPWHLPADLKRFKTLTMGHHIIMGRNTFESIGRALPGRISVVVTRQTNYFVPPEIIISESPEQAIHFAKEHGDEEAFIIGGAELLKSTLPLADRFYLTRIHHKFEADTFLPELDNKEWMITEETDFSPDDKNLYPYTFLTLERNTNSRSA